MADEGISQDEQIDNKQFMEIVELSLAEIQVEFRNMVELRDIKDLSYEEIMDITGLPMGTVKSRINRGRARLYAIVKKKYKSGTNWGDLS